MFKGLNLSEKEILLLEDKDFLLTKSKVLDKIYQLLEITRNELKEFAENSGFNFPEGMSLATGKISKGENYKNLPYMVLDYPALFSAENVFAYRTMFWWGNFFSTTLHLEGTSLNRYRRILSDNLVNLLNNKIYLGVGDLPWQYHYGKDNYVRLSKNHRDFIADCMFLKLSRKIQLKDWQMVPGFATDYFKLLLSSLRTRND